MKKFLIVIEKTPHGFSSFSPDLPGCIATGKTKKTVEKRMKEAMEFHLEGLLTEGEKIPQSHSYAKYCHVNP